MTDVTNGRPRPRPGSIGITIQVIEYNGATGAYRTVKTVSYRPSAALIRPAIGQSRRTAA